MRYINIEKVKSGMVLAKEVFDDDGRVLLAANTILTKEYIIRLSIRGYQGVYIEDELSRGIQIDEVISIELRNEGAKAVKEGNVWCAGKYLYQATDIVGNMITDLHLMLTGGDASQMTFMTKIN